MISLLIIAHEEQEKLSVHLPALLSQEGAEYEVVVVDMNSEDDTLGENVISMVFQKGFKLGDKVIRFAMVQVAN